MNERDTTITDDSIEREFAALAAALRADASEPSHEFAHDLDEGVRAGFPRRRRLPTPPKLPKLRRPPMPALAAAASVVAAVAVVVALSDGNAGDEVAGGGATSEVGTGGARGQTEAAPSAGASSGAADSAAGVVGPQPLPPAPGGGFAPGERNRRIERSASLALVAPADRLDRVADGVAGVTDRYGGFVVRSSLSTGDDSGEGEFELRIPARSLRPALRDLAKLGVVRSRAQSGQDVTRQFASAEDRLEGARAERRSLLRRLEGADSDAETEALRRRLDLSAGEIRGLRGQVRDLRARTDYASVSVTIEKEDRDGGSGSGGRDGLGAAVDDAVDSLAGSVEILVRVLGVAIPLGVLALLACLGARAAQRRRREAALP